MASTQTLYLVRHAFAMERGEQWPDDAMRPLLLAGAARFRGAVIGLGALDVTISLVLTSPLVRAVQTADILVRGLVPHPELVTLPALAPGVPPARATEALGPYGKATGLALVGHEPGIGELAAWLVGARAPLPFKKGGICRIDAPAWPPRQGTLGWFATPRMLRALGEGK
jgi:phosphohistidine phosphatase